MKIDDTVTSTLEFTHKKLVVCDRCEYWNNQVTTQKELGVVTKREQSCQNYDMCKRAIEKYVDLKNERK